MHFTCEFINYFPSERRLVKTGSLEHRPERSRFMSTAEPATTTTPCVVPLVNQLELQLRFLGPADIDCVKALCRSWFPIEYPDTWFQEITSNPRFYSLAATFQV